MQPGHGYQPEGQPPQIPNHMAWSIISIFLFWPLAIPAIINSSKVNTLLAQGDVPGAQQASNEARKWAKLATIIGIVLWVLTIICYGVFFALILKNGSTTTP